eukprot:280476_1
MSNSKMCINNIDIFYTWKISENSKVNFETTDIYKSIINPTGLKYDELDYDTILWKNYTLTRSMSNGIVFSDNCEYTFYDKTNGVFIQCVDSLKLFTTIPRNEISLKLHTCPHKGSGLTTTELESLYVTIIGKKLVNTENNANNNEAKNDKEWVSSDPISLSHFPRNIIESGKTPSFDNYYTKVKSNFKIKNYISASTFFSNYNGILRGVKFDPKEIYINNDYENNIINKDILTVPTSMIGSFLQLRIFVEQPRYSYFWYREDSLISTPLKGFSSSLKVNYHSANKFIHETDLIRLVFGYKLPFFGTFNPFEEVTAMVGDVYFHLLDCYYENIIGFELEEDPKENERCPGDVCNNYETVETAQQACTEHEECTVVVKINEDTWQLRKQVFEIKSKEDTVYGTAVWFGHFDSPDMYEKTEWSGVIDPETCIEKCKSYPDPICKGIMYLRKDARCKKLSWSGNMIPGDLNSDPINWPDQDWEIWIIPEINVNQIQLDEAKLKICNKNIYNYELPYTSIIVPKSEKKSMYDFEKQCMRQYHSHLASIHSLEQENAAALQVSVGLRSWVGYSQRENYGTWQFNDFTESHQTDFKQHVNSIPELYNALCTVLTVNDEVHDQWFNAEMIHEYCDEGDTISSGICGTYGFFSNEYRTFVFNIEQDMNEISIINIFIETGPGEENKNEEISICIDEVELVSSTQFNKAGTVGSIIKNEIKNNEQSYIFLKYPVCNIEIVDTMLQFDKKVDIDTDDVIAGFQCKNYNRFATSSCDVEQSYTKEDSFSASVSHSSETSYSVSRSETNTVSMSTSVAVTVGLEYENGIEDKSIHKVTAKGEIAVGFQFSSEYAQSTEIGKSSTYATASEDGFTNTISKSVSCSASVDVPRGHQQSYSLIFSSTNSTIPTASDLKLTLCSYYIEYDKNENSEPMKENHFEYLYGVPGKIEIVQTSACKVEFEAPKYLNNQLTCHEEQALAFLSQDIWIPVCNVEDSELYDGCQCVIGDKLTESECICTDIYGNLIDDGSGIVVDATFGWENTCRSLNCSDSKYTGQSIVVSEENQNDVMQEIIAAHENNENEIKNNVGYGKYHRFDIYLWTSVIVSFSFLCIAAAFVANTIHKYCSAKNEIKYTALGMMSEDSEMDV